MRKLLNRVVCFLLGHKPKLLYQTYVRDGRRFIKCCPIYRCKRCGLIYHGFGVLNPQLVELIRATFQDLPDIKWETDLRNYGHINRIFKK